MRVSQTPILVTVPRTATFDVSHLVPRILPLTLPFGQQVPPYSHRRLVPRSPNDNSHSVNFCPTLRFGARRCFAHLFFACNSYPVSTVNSPPAPEASLTVRPAVMFYSTPVLKPILPTAAGLIGLQITGVNALMTVVATFLVDVSTVTFFGLFESSG